MFVYNNHLLCMYLLNPPLEQDVTWGHFVKHWLVGFNSEFSFFETSCHGKVKELILPYYLLIAGGKIVGFIFFSIVSTLCMMQTALEGFELGSPCSFSTIITITPPTSPLYHCRLFYHINNKWSMKIKYILFSAYHIMRAMTILHVFHLTISTRVGFEKVLGVKKKKEKGKIPFWKQRHILKRSLQVEAIVSDLG